MAKLTAVKHLKALAVEVQKYVQNLVGELAQSVVETVEEMDAAKSDKGTSVTFSIPTSGWVASGTGEYAYYYDIAAVGVTFRDCANVMIAPSSMSTAVACGICPTNETLAGKIRIRSEKIPTSAISCEYRIDKGKET